MKTIRVAINGFGRIGRAFFREARKRRELEVVAINDLADIENIAYLLRYDSVYGRFGEEVRVEGGALIVGSDAIRYVSKRDPAELPWRELGVDVVVEATGFFSSYAASRAHLEAGAKRVVITAPVKDEASDGATVLLGLNEGAFAQCSITSNASCTTNAASPVIAILDEAIGIEKALLNTVHAYTATQSLVDSPMGKKGMREGRAAAQNIVPSSTGAAIAVTKAYPKLDGLFDGISLRVPVICGSIADVTFIAKRPTAREEVNDVLRKAAKDKRWEGIFSVSEEELVSSDIVGRTEGAIAELSMTRVVGLPAAPGAAQAGGNLVKVLTWYDNELGYASTLVAHVIKAGE